ncbi:MAG: hypothetical protein ABR555_05150 [Pyrinomonadaceae bacterium]
MSLFRLIRLAALSVLCLIPAVAAAQSTTSTANTNVAAQQEIKPTVVIPAQRPPAAVAGRTNLTCAGYIRFQKFPPMPEIVGAEEEQEQRTFADRDIVYINEGAQQGLKEGQTFQIIRPRGDVKGVFKSKKGFLGTYVQEVGRLQVFKVNERTSAAKITYSCYTILLGDLLTPVPGRESPLERPEVTFDRFADPSGKQTGRLMMARDGREMVSKDDVVYIDLGQEDKVAPGDFLTIYRPLGTGNLTRMDNEESARGRATGFQSNRFRGGGFGMQAQRAKDSTAFVNSEGRYRYRPITTRQIKNHRPPMPRKIVGEMVIIDVQLRTATAIITRVAEEVHTGDWVEIQ